ncbi:unnamed protein product, partial [Polarella glacialis]
NCACAVVVSTATGRQIPIQFSSSDTVRNLKEQLQETMGKPASMMRLIHGFELLQDDWVVLEHGVAEGAGLTLVLVALPCGTFELQPGSRPAGMNTSASVLAVFQSDASVALTVDETEITSDYEDADYDPYEFGAAFHQRYLGCAQRGEADQLTISVLEFSQKGRRRGRPADLDFPQGLTGAVGETDEEVKLEIYFSAGGCNEGVAGLKWITLHRTSIEPLSTGAHAPVRHRKFGEDADFEDRRQQTEERLPEAKAKSSGTTT